MGNRVGFAAGDAAKLVFNTERCSKLCHEGDSPAQFIGSCGLNSRPPRICAIATVRSFGSVGAIRCEFGLSAIKDTFVI